MNHQTSAQVEDQFLILDTESVLPKRCVKTNEPTSEFLVRKFVWPPTPTLTVMLKLLTGNIFSGLLLATGAKAMKLRIPLSPSLISRRRNYLRIISAMMVACWIGFAITIYLLVSLFRGDPDKALKPVVPNAPGMGMEGEMIPILILLPGCILIFTFAAILYHRFLNVLGVHKMVDGRCWLFGCHHEFLQSIKAPYQARAKTPTKEDLDLEDKASEWIE